MQLLPGRRRRTWGRAGPTLNSRKVPRMCDGVVRWGVALIVAGMVGVGVAADSAVADTEPCAVAADLLLRIVESPDTDLHLVESLLDSVERCGGLEAAAVEQAIQAGAPQPIPVTASLDPCGNLLGDLNTDGHVNVADYMLLLLDWGPCSGCPADLDRDGQVGPLDIIALLVNWGETLYPGDITGNRRVDTQDLVVLLTNWGPCDGCPGDLNGDGAVNVLDLIMLLIPMGDDLPDTRPPAPVSGHPDRCL